MVPAELAHCLTLYPQELDQYKKTFALAVSLVAAGLFAAHSLAQLPRQSAPEEARVYFVTPAHGQVVPETFTVVVGLSGMGVAPAGMELQNTGHHHLVVNGEDDINLDMPLGDNVTHFGLGETETTLTLPPGEHTLQLILGEVRKDHGHRALNSDTCRSGTSTFIDICTILPENRLTIA